MDFVDVRRLISLLWRWVWLLVLGLFLGVVAGYIAGRVVSPVYETSTKVLVARTRQQQSTDIVNFSDQQLVLTYVQILKTQPILEALSQKLGYEVSADQIVAQQIVDTQLIYLRVQSPDPQHAADIANTLVELLITQNSDLQAGKFDAAEEGLQQQLQNLDTQIKDLQAQIEQLSNDNIKNQLAQVNTELDKLNQEISTLETDLAALPIESLRGPNDRARAAEIETQLPQKRQLVTLYQEIQTNLIYLGRPVTSGVVREDLRLTNLQSTLNLYQQLYLNTQNTLESTRSTRLQYTPNVSQVEVAEVPFDPIRPQPVLYIVLAGAMGLVLTAFTVIVIDLFDNTLNTAPQVERALNLPVVGVIADIRHPAKERLVATDPYLSEAEAFRMLEINLEVVAGEKGCRTLLVTSPGAGEGKTVLAANLAAALALSGKRVVLVDANLRRPRLHAAMSVENKNGFTDMLGDLPLWVEQGKLSVFETSQGKNFYVLPSGSPAANPAELVQSSKLGQVIEKLHSAADYIILDGAPLFVSDTQILAAKVDGLLLVIQAGFTEAETAQTLLTQLKRVGANILGIALNRIPRSDVAYYKSYRAYAPAATRTIPRFSFRK